MAYEHRTGRINSGDVTLFYRLFGKPEIGRAHV